MNRRLFLRNCGIAGAALLTPSLTRAGQSCGPIAPYVSRCTAGIPSELIQVSALQQQSEWCWAACIEMVFRYYGYVVPQARIVRETWGSVVNMPGQPEQILDDLNRVWVDASRRKFQSTADSMTANAATAVADLQEDRPLIIGALGHAVVLTALTYDVNTYSGAWQVVAATVRDPWPGRGRRILAPQEWFNIGFAARILVEAADDDDDN